MRVKRFEGLEAIAGLFRPAYDRGRGQPVEVAIVPGHPRPLKRRNRNPVVAWQAGDKFDTDPEAKGPAAVPVGSTGRGWAGDFICRQGMTPDGQALLDEAVERIATLEPVRAGLVLELATPDRPEAEILPLRRDLRDCVAEMEEMTRRAKKVTRWLIYVLNPLQAAERIRSSAED